MEKRYNSYVDHFRSKYGDRLQKLVLEWLDYGKLRGLGQWRNSGKGRFTYELLPEG